MDPDSSLSALALQGDSDPYSILSLIILGVLLIITALISGSEMAFFSMKSADKQALINSQKGVDQLVIKLFERPRALLATIAISSNTLNFTIILLAVWLLNGYSPETGLITVLLVIAPSVFLATVLLPKILAGREPLGFARLVARSVYIARKLFQPFIALQIRMDSFFNSRKKGSGLSMDELEQALEMGEQNGAPPDEQKILRGIVRFGSTTVKQIMKPRTDVLAFDIDEDFPTVMQQLLERGYSRIPVYKDNFDVIVGLLYTKDLLPHIDEPADFEWNKLLREPFFVPGSKKIDDMLKEFQEKKIHMAIVVDEFGGTAGIVTLEDVIEEIVGDISDEFDVEELVYSKLDENNYVFEGKTQISDFYRVLDMTDEPFNDVRGEFDTLAGLFLQLAGHFPHRGEQLNYNRFTFTVEAVDQRRIVRIKVTLNHNDGQHKEQ